MTREEAKEYWTAKYEAAREWDDPHWEASERKEHRRYVDALKAALEALKAKTDGDLISREDAIKVSAEWMHEEFGYLDLNRGERFINAIESLPSAEADWIPREHFDVLKKNYDMLAGLLEEAKARAIGAWMPLPEPYKGGDEK